MFFSLPDPVEVPLQVLAQQIDGTPKLDVVSGTVRVFILHPAGETVILAPTALVSSGASWRYVWTPTSLADGQYIVEFTLLDTDGLTCICTEDLVVRDIPGATDVVLTASHGSGSWGAGALTPQNVRDAMKLAPSPGAPAVGSVDARLIDIATAVTIIRKVETGRWKIVANQMIFYEDDGSTPLLVFNLLDDHGAPSMKKVYERAPV